MPRITFAQAALVSFDAGTVRIEGRPGEPPLVTDQPGLAGWLMGFMRAREVDAALAEIADARARDVAARALRYLLASGALVEESRLAPDPRTDSREQLAAIARDAYDLGCDIAAFGPHAEAVVAEGGGATMAARLQGIRGSLIGLRSVLARARTAYVDRQLSDATDGASVKLHLGCGPYLIDGWVNVDVHPAPLALNVLWGLPFADGAASHVFMSHMLEHLFYPNDVHAVLCEIRRVLCPGGRARFIVPDIGACIHAYARHDAGFFTARTEHWGAGDGSSTLLEGFLAYAGAGPEPGWLWEAHKFGFDFETLARALTRAGFEDISQSAFMGSPDAALRIDDRSQVARAAHDGQHYSLFVEAVRPRER